LFAVLGGLLASSGARAQDTIRFTDPKSKKEATASGSILQESASRVTYASGTAGVTKEIAAADIRDIIYEVPGGVRLDYRKAAGEERLANDPATQDSDRRTKLVDAIQNYQAVLPRLTAEKRPFAARHAEFKISQLRALQAQDDRAAAPAAIAALEAFLKNYPDSWQITRCARLLADLQLDQGDAGGAEKTYEALAANPNLPPEARQDCDFALAEALIRGGKFDRAEQKLQTILRGQLAADPRAIRARIYLAECTAVAQKGNLAEAVAALEDIIARTTDNDIKAAAYNALGDCYRLTGNLKDARWPYLWVDLLYTQNRQEHSKAMEQLARIFEEQHDPARARQYRDRLKRDGR
jgi:tetratricopeptide (TPR) repeat protein